MAELNQIALAKVSTKTGVDMKTAGATTLYTVPSGKTFIPVLVVIHSSSASLAGGESYSFTNWRTTVDLSDMTTPGTDFRVLDGDNFYYTVCAAGTNFQITVVNGTSATCTATIDVFGYLF
jgi:hypothetical protein